jgi:hypothetical protein
LLSSSFISFSSLFSLPIRFNLLYNGDSHNQPLQGGEPNGNEVMSVLPIRNKVHPQRNHPRRPRSDPAEQLTSTNGARTMNRGTRRGRSAHWTATATSTFVRFFTTETPDKFAKAARQVCAVHVHPLLARR